MFSHFFRKLYISLVVLSLWWIFTPFVHAASLRIHEIMYNPEGSDTHKEWVEIYNNGGDDIPLEQWFFWENDTFHGLHPDGFTVLHPGEYAVIVPHLADAKALLGGGIRYVKSSFSLNNTGEEIKLADENKTIVSSVHYHKDQGADGNGKSLQWWHGQWREGTPTPGRENSISSSPEGGNAQQNGEAEGEAATATINEIHDEEDDSHIEKTYTFSLHAPSEVFPGEKINFDIDVAKGGEKVLDGVFILNFGDGHVDMRRTLKHRYTYTYTHPGEYPISFRYYENTFSYEQEDTPVISYQKIIQVHPFENGISIEKVNPYDGVVLKNKTKKEAQLRDWSIQWKEKRFSFRDASYIPAHGTLRVPYRVLGFSPFLQGGEKVFLKTELGFPVAFYPLPPKKRIKKKQKVLRKEERYSISAKEEKEKKENTEHFLFRNLPDYENQEVFHTYLQKHPGKILIPFEDEDLPHYDSPQERGDNTMLLFITSFLLIAVSLRLLLKKDHKGGKEEDDTKSFPDIEILS